MNDDKARGVLLTWRKKTKTKKHYPAYGNVPEPELDRKQRSSLGDTRLVSVGKRDVFLNRFTWKTPRTLTCKIPKPSLTDH